MQLNFQCRGLAPFAGGKLVKYLFALASSLPISLVISFGSLNMQFVPGLLLLFSFSFLGLCLGHMEVPRLGGPIDAVATGLCHSHSNARSEPCL